jgi:hypothetical protein
VESYEFRQWRERRRIEAGSGQWVKGDWDVPYQEEAGAVEQASRLVDLCMKSFQRAARQLANLRLVRAKTARARRRDLTRTMKGNYPLTEGKRDNRQGGVPCVRIPLDFPELRAYIVTPDLAASQDTYSQIGRRVLCTCPMKSESRSCS